MRVRVRWAGLKACATTVVVCAAAACGPQAQVSDDVFTPAHRSMSAAARDSFHIRATPQQPIPFPHKTHIAKGAECTDCHETVEKGPVAGIPSVKTCMVCHSQIATTKPLIKEV